MLSSAFKAFSGINTYIIVEDFAVLFSVNSIKLYSDEFFLSSFFVFVGILWFVISKSLASRSANFKLWLVFYIAFMLSLRNSGTWSLLYWSMYPFIFSFSLAKNRLKSLSKKKHTCCHIFRYWSHLRRLMHDSDWVCFADPSVHTFQWLFWCDLWYSPTSHSCDQVADLAVASIIGIYGRASIFRKGWKAAMIIFSLFTYKYYIHPIGSSLIAHIIIC